jgi:streptogramin lyase
VSGRARRLSPWPAVAAALALSAPAGAVVLGGEVRGRDGAPVAGAEVTAYATERGIAVTIYGADDGRFGFPPMGDGRYELRARAPGGARGTTRLDTGAQDLFRTTTIVLDRAPPRGEREAAPAAEVRAAVVTTWAVGDTGSVLHDVAVGGAAAYAVDRTHPLLYRLDVRTGERRAFAVPGGAPYALAVAPDGVLWMTLPSANELVRFSPADESFAIVPQVHGLRPHALRLGANGVLWYTLAVSNHVGAYDPATGVQRVYPLPAPSWPQALALRAVPLARWLGRLDDDPERGAGASGLPLPSGIDIAPDGGVWVTQRNGRQIGRLDPQDGATRMIDTPLPAPRRLRADARGRLWIVSAEDRAALARYDPVSDAFASWTVPAASDDAGPPVALDVDPRADAVWLAGTRTDALVRFTAGDERATVYPLPGHVAEVRGVAVDDEGAVWTCGANPPALVRLEP